MTAARIGSHLPLNAVERTTGRDVSGVQRRLDSRFDAAQDVSNRAEDRFLTAVLSTSRFTAEYAELLDDSVECVCSRSDDAAN